MSNCENCDEPLSEFEMCSYGELCMSCHDREESPCNGCQDEDCLGCDYEETEE